jgi:hypothetical protein
MLLVYGLNTGKQQQEELLLFVVDSNSIWLTWSLLILAAFESPFCVNYSSQYLLHLFHIE